eukprot:4352890-Pyramimonas_sp.AAC.1
MPRAFQFNRAMAPKIFLKIGLNGGPPAFLNMAHHGANYQVEQRGSLQRVASAEALWENGRCERHGGWVNDSA